MAASFILASAVSPERFQMIRVDCSQTFDDVECTAASDLLSYDMSGIGSVVARYIRR